VHVACGRVSILVSRRCNVLCISGFVDDITFSYSGPYGGVTLPQQLRALLQRRVNPNIPVSCSWLCFDLEDGGRQDQMSPSCKGQEMRGRSMRCTIALFRCFLYMAQRGR